MDDDSEFIRLARAVIKAEDSLGIAPDKRKPRLGWIVRLTDIVRRARLEFANYLKNHPTALICLITTCTSYSVPAEVGSFFVL